MSAKLHLLLFMVFIGILAINSGLKSNEVLKFKGSLGSFSESGMDSRAVKERIIGEWIWDSSIYLKTNTSCYAGIYYKVVFFRNSEVKVFKNDQLIQSSKYQISKRSKDFFINTFPPVDYVSGILSMDQHKLELIDVDESGGVYYFSRKN